MELSKQSTSERVQKSQHSIGNLLIKDFAKDRITKILHDAGITVQGENDWDILVHDDRFYNRVLLKWSLGFGESYMDGWWDTKALDQLVFKLYTSSVDNKNNNLPSMVDMCKARLINQQSKNRAHKVAHVHYDLGNDMYAMMLGNTMQYTCAYWKQAKTLDAAQVQKLDLICRK
ncbi:MAG: hypothetical protein C0612_02495, partial [Desulfobulbaceae bacterium]